MSSIRKTLDEFAFAIHRVRSRVHAFAATLGRLDDDIPNWVERSRRIRLNTDPWPSQQVWLSAGGAEY